MPFKCHIITTDQARRPLYRWCHLTYGQSPKAASRNPTLGVRSWVLRVATNLPQVPPLSNHSNYHFWPTCPSHWVLIKSLLTVCCLILYQQCGLWDQRRRARSETIYRPRQLLAFDQSWMRPIWIQLAFLTMHSKRLAQRRFAMPQVGPSKLLCNGKC